MTFFAVSGENHSHLIFTPPAETGILPVRVKIIRRMVFARERGHPEKTAIFPRFLGNGAELAKCSRPFANSENAVNHYHDRD